MPATASKQTESAPITMRHLDGCPVPDKPDDEALQARVEQYFAEKKDPNGKVEARFRVLHCCECGYMEHIKE